MVAQRRLGPLVACVGVALAVVLVRLFQVQVVEHTVWAGQADQFLRDSSVLPYHRGRFLDRNGTPLVADQDGYRLEMVYRDFRRAHPLGLVAHARSAIEMRPVTLVESDPTAEAWAVEIALVSPARLARFVAGEPLVASDGRAWTASSAEPATERRADRAQDLRFYALRLLAATSDESAGVRRESAETPSERSFLEQIAAARRVDPSIVRAEIEQRVASSRTDLGILAERIEKDQPHALGDGAGDARARLLALLDARRADQEDDAADDLFELACGFAAGRVPTHVLQDSIDLSWLAVVLRWDSARLRDWIERRRTDWEAQRDRVILPRVLARADSAADEVDRAQTILDGLAALFDAQHAREPRPWRDVDELVVLDEAGSLFSHAGRSKDLKVAPAVLAFQESDARATPPENEDPWELVGRVLARQAVLAGEPDPTAAAVADTWRKLSRSRGGLASDAARTELTHAAELFERRLAAECERVFALLRSDGGPRRLATERLDRAKSRERYLLVDAQSRAARLRGEPSYDLVHLVVRDPQRYAGFAVCRTTQRRALVRDAEGRACAGLLIGNVRRPLLRELVESASTKRSREDRDEDPLQGDAWKGDSGLEALLDVDLRGKSGSYTTQALSDEARGNEPALVVPATDGPDVVLTLDAALQNAAQEVINHPEMPSGGETDRTWFENPVGAIVLMTVDGDVLAAASAPGESGHPAIPGRGHERTQMRERTLQTPTFNPPGSVFKPFVAVYALDRLGFDPATTFPCVPNPSLKDGAAGFENLRCAGTHWSKDLHGAIVVSCNAYFAQLGLRYTPEKFLEVAHLFGFGEPTGITDLGDGAQRGGLREDWAFAPHTDEPHLLAKLSNRSDHLRFPSGLGTLWSSPMQVARAFAGLATGRLPDVRVVQRIGSHEVAHRSKDLELGEPARAFVHAAMRDVVNDPQGSANHKGLDTQSLGFALACKTGSADIGDIQDVEGLGPDDRAALVAGKGRKHAWLAGWFPAEHPRYVIVVYMHSVVQTSGHTAVWIAGQFLRSPAVRASMAEPAR